MERLFDPFPNLETERTLLRAPSPADADAFFTLYSDPEVVRYYDLPVFERREQAETLLAEWEADLARRASVRWSVLVDGEVVGSATLCGVRRDHRFAELGYVLRRDHWGQGLATEFVGRVVEFGLGPGALHRMEALVDPRNSGSLRLLEKLGFVREGVLRGRFWKDGIALDDVMYARLATDAVRKQGR